MAIVTVGCSVGPSGDIGFGDGPASATTLTSAGAGSDSSSDDAATGSTSHATDDPTAATAATTGGDATDSADASTTGTDTSTDTEPDATTTGTNGGSLDPDLDVPDGGQVCQTPGSLGECPSLQVCRFYTTEESRCESCDVCGNLGDTCTEGTDCDILFACYQGRCTNICPLGTSYCGPVEDCLDVGHPTHGVCDPFA